MVGAGREPVVAGKGEMERANGYIVSFWSDEKVLN